MLLSANRIKIVWGVYWIIWFSLTHAPKLPQAPARIPHLDKVAHLAGFAVLAVLAVVHRAKTGRHATVPWSLRWLAIFAAYAAFDELTQPVFQRSAELADFVADMLGVLAVFGLTALRRTRSTTAD